MLKVKPGAKLNGLTTHMVIAIIVCESVYDKYNTVCVITEGTGGKHGRGSLHYVGNAIDTRTRDFMSKGIQESAYLEIKEALGEQYDVINEGDHFHIEYQPK